MTTPEPTPPAAGQGPGAVESNDGANVGPVSGNRTPMVVMLVVLGVIVVMVALLVGFSFVGS